MNVNDRLLAPAQRDALAEDAERQQRADAQRVWVDAIAGPRPDQASAHRGYLAAVDALRKARELRTDRAGAPELPSDPSPVLCSSCGRPARTTVAGWCVPCRILASASSRTTSTSLDTSTGQRQDVTG